MGRYLCRRTMCVPSARRLGEQANDLVGCRVGSLVGFPGTLPVGGIGFGAILWRQGPGVSTSGGGCAWLRDGAGRQELETRLGCATDRRRPWPPVSVGVFHVLELLRLLRHRGVGARRERVVLAAPAHGGAGPRRREGGSAAAHRGIPWSVRRRNSVHARLLPLWHRRGIAAVHHLLHRVGILLELIVHRGAHLDLGSEVLLRVRMTSLSCP
mmetsp:Transcript_21111/g.49414  ORF Transcript_21111/g.49414 Transcript_21111/m.49414 type:complete len:212 (-) Transcript_21111:631-1266(-)